MKEQNKTSFRIISDYDSIGNQEVFSPLLKVLMAYALKLIGDSTLRLSKNKADLAYDLAMEAIKRYLEDPTKFDPTRNPDLVFYLKYNILRRLISNHKNLEGQQKEVLYESHDTNGILVESAFSEAFDIHSAIDLKDTLEKINLEIEKDLKLKAVFELRYAKDYKPSEVMEELEISSKEYSNRIRRVDTIKKRILSLTNETN